MTTKVQAASQLPIQHLSVRVPWHDSAWNGTICQRPADNASCQILKNVRENRVDSEEIPRSGRAFTDLSQSELPPCAAERSGFMSKSELRRVIPHPHSGYSPPHKLLKPIDHKHPPYTADCIPFRWMLASNAEEVAEEYDIKLVPELEDRAEELMGFSTNWVEDGHNQRALLDTFFSAVEPERSLCFFYAKDTPLADDSRRVIVGVGWVTTSHFKNYPHDLL